MIKSYPVRKVYNLPWAKRKGRTHFYTFMLWVQAPPKPLPEQILNVRNEGFLGN